MERSQIKFLAIDDSPDNILVLKALMNEFFPEARFFSSPTGKRGLEICAKEMPDVVLLDIVMPEMDGYEICSAIKQNKALRHVLVVMITAAKTDVESRTRALECGADAFLSKPVDETEFKAQITAMLRIREADIIKLNEKERLEEIVNERTAQLEKELEVRKKTESELQIAVSNLEKSKQAALNLMEDLQQEMKEKMHTQEILKNSEERFRLVFENSPVGVLSFGEDGIIKACNNQFVSIIGSSHEKLVGLDMTKLPDKNITSALDQCLRGEKSIYQGPYKSYTADKQTEVRLQFSPIFDENCRVSGGVGIVEDITEQTRFEAQRRELEERFSKSFYSSPVAISLTYFESGEMVDVNNAFCRLTGYTRDQLIGNSVISMGIITTDLREKLIDELQKHGYIKQAELPLIMRNREVRIIMMSIEVYEMSGKKYLLSTLLDITERKQYEQELAKLTRAVEQSPVSIVITDLDGNIVYVNPKVVETTGYFPGELIGRNPRILKSGETSEIDYQNLYKTISSGDTWHGEFHDKKKNGELYWESASISPVINEDGEMTHFIAIKEDITEWKMLKHDLIENEKLYRNIFSGNPLPMWIYDVESFGFIEVNEAATREYGYSKEEFLQMTLLDIRPEEDIPMLLADVKLHQEEVQESKNWRHKKKDGSIIDVEIVSHAVPSQTGRSHRMVMVYNVTDKLVAQETLQKAKAIAEANDRLKTAFLNNISHEVRTPLNGILGATTLLNDPDISREEIGEMTEIINLSTDRLLRTITDYMDISLITSGNMELHENEFSLDGLIENLKEKFQSIAESKQIEFRKAIPKHLHNFKLKSDEELLGKALIHLIDNAIKFTKSGFVEIGFTIQNSAIRIFVEDSGIGIHESAVENIFTAFAQEDSSSSRRFEGSGLGLAIVKGVAELLGGNARVESVKNKGSKFYVELPAEKINIEFMHGQNETEPKARVAHRKNVILVAEDDDSNFYVLDLLIRQTTNAVVIRASNGMEAVEMCTSNQDIGLVLMDIKMPVMDGLEATRRIKEKMPDLKVVAITAYAMSGDEHRALAAGCDDYIAKPVALKTLKAKIEMYGIEMKQAQQ
ncbi:MAG: PAS domain S-box protein [Bacteroidetes bacterium]|nr:PAS domain S-box protein [Bacteroidota bacterium]